MSIIKILQGAQVDRFVRFSGVGFFGERNVALEYDGAHSASTFLFVYGMDDGIIMAASSAFADGVATVNLFTEPLAAAFSVKKAQGRIGFAAMLVDKENKEIIGRGQFVIENSGFAHGEIPDPVEIESLDDRYVKRTDLVGVKTIDEMLQVMIGGK